MKFNLATIISHNPWRYHVGQFRSEPQESLRTPRPRQSDDVSQLGQASQHAEARYGYQDPAANDVERLVHAGRTSDEMGEMIEAAGAEIDVTN